MTVELVCEGCMVVAGEAPDFATDCPVHGWKPTPKPFVNERHYLIEYLKSDLYERRDVPGDELGMTWVSPLRWKVRISGSRQDPTVEIFNPAGTLYRKGEHVTVSFLEGCLP